MILSLQKCYHCFDPNFSRFTNRSVSTNNNIGKNTGSMTTMLTTLELLIDDNQFLDLGATNHITNDLSNLNFGFEYCGRNKIYKGNGAGLMIAHFSFPSLYSSNSPKVFSLSNLLHVPHISLNLINVRQFARENNAFIEFHLFICIVKDLAT